MLIYPIGDICTMKQKTVQEEKVVDETTQSRSKTLENDSPKPGKQRRSKAQIDAIRKAGIQIACIAGAITTLSSIKWTVASQTVQGLLYVVSLSSLGMRCQCEANQNGKKICKHVVGVYKLLDKEWWCGRRKRIQIRRKKLRCQYPKCRSKDVVGWGERKCKRKRSVRRYMCKKCGRTFSGMEGFKGRHFDASVIAKALSMMATKMSPEEVCVQLAMDEIIINPSTIHRWTDEYSRIMLRFSSLLCLDAWFQWHVDELEFKIRKQTRYLFGVIDGASRFVLSHEILKKKKGSDPTNLFQMAAARTRRLPRILVSDGLQEFIKPARKVFFRRAGSMFVHIRDIHIQNLFNQNNVYERLNGEFEDRLKCVCGLKSEDPGLLRLIIVYHNFFRKHTSLKNNMTPAKAIGIDIIPVKDSDLADSCDAWITFIQNASIRASA